MRLALPSCFLALGFLVDVRCFATPLDDYTLRNSAFVSGPCGCSGGAACSWRSRLHGGSYRQWACDGQTARRADVRQGHSCRWKRCQPRSCRRLCRRRRWLHIRPGVIRPTGWGINAWTHVGAGLDVVRGRCVVSCAGEQKGCRRRSSQSVRSPVRYQGGGSDCLHSDRLRFMSLVPSVPHSFRSPHGDTITSLAVFAAYENTCISGIAPDAKRRKATSANSNVSSALPLPVRERREGRRWCESNFVNWRTMETAVLIRAQLLSACQRLGIGYRVGEDGEARMSDVVHTIGAEESVALRRCLTAACFLQVCLH